MAGNVPTPAPTAKTIVSVETSSTKKKKGRRKHAPRNHKPLPEDVMLKPGHSDSISNIPDSFSNSLSKDEEAETKWLTNDQIPHLFTFDLVPSFSEDPFGDDATEGNDTTDANIGEEADRSGIFDGFLLSALFWTAERSSFHPRLLSVEVLQFFLLCQIEKLGNMM